MDGLARSMKSLWVTDFWVHLGFQGEVVLNNCNLKGLKSVLVVLGPTEKPTHFESFNLDKIQPR